MHRNYLPDELSYRERDNEPNLPPSPEAYDLSGNMTNDGLNTITYDGEGRAVTASGGLGSGTYTYDGNGLRVKKVAGSTTTVYIFSGSKVIAEYANGAAPSSPTREYIYAGGALLARIDSSGTNYYHQDHLSNRMMTNSSGGVAAEMGHFPFGESWYNTTNDKLYFTTYEYDSESGNHYAMARYHESRLGRLSSPDPLAGSTANPQSLNRYSYSINDPANVTDPSGASPPGGGCNTVQEQPKDKSQQASGGGRSDTDNSDAGADAGDADPDPPPQNGCISHTAPSDGFDPFGSDSIGSEFFGTGDDSGMLPSGAFQVGQSGPGSMAYALIIEQICGSQTGGGSSAFSDTVNANCNDFITQIPLGEGNGLTPPNNGPGYNFQLFPGLRVPGQTFEECMKKYRGSYSMGGAAGTLVGSEKVKNAGDAVAGNIFLDAYFEGPQLADGLAALVKGMGSPLTFGRRSGTTLIALNTAGKGGVPQALSASGKGARSLLGKVDRALSFGLTFAEKAIVDFSFAGGEAIACSH